VKTFTEEEFANTKPRRDLELGSKSYMIEVPPRHPQWGPRPEPWCMGHGAWGQSPTTWTV